MRGLDTDKYCPCVQGNDVTCSWRCWRCTEHSPLRERRMPLSIVLCSDNTAYSPVLEILFLETTDPNTGQTSCNRRDPKRHETSADNAQPRPRPMQQRQRQQETAHCLVPMAPSPITRRWSRNTLPSKRRSVAQPRQNTRKNKRRRKKSAPSEPLN